MERATKARTGIRRQLTRKMTQIQQELEKVPVQPAEVNAKIDAAETISYHLEELDKEIQDLMLDGNVEAEEEGGLYDQELDKCQEYRDNFLSTKKKAEMAIRQPEPSEAGSFSTATDRSVVVGNQKKKCTLPKLKLKEFHGTIKEWLGFWSSFKRIHEDDEMSVEDKFEYLDMAVPKGSRAWDLLDAYPRIPENYQKAVDALISRFGREEMQVEFYMRELHKLVASNLSQGKEKLSLPRLFDQLDSHLRALESLGVTQDKNSVMLVPMVESCLPVPVLRAWERSPISKKDGSKESPPKTRLHFLMDFLRLEVESEERIAMAMEGFGKLETKSEPHHQPRKMTTKVKKYEEARTPTAAGFVNEIRSAKCIFCEEDHDLESCTTVRKMPMHERKEKLRKSGRCFKCTQKGCFARDCKSQRKCFVCGKQHHAIVCSQLTSMDERDRKPWERRGSKDSNKDKDDDEVKSTTTTSNFYNATGETYLQTAMVTLVNGDKRRTVRALLDSGSQTTHVKSSTLKEMGFKDTGTVTLKHGLFGGVEKEAVHRKYDISIMTGVGKLLPMDILDQDKICGKLPSVSRGKWMSELRAKGIWINDVQQEDREIEMIIGGKWFGKFLTKEVEQLSCGLTAVKTIVGWTVMGEFSNNERSHSQKKTSHSMLCSSMAVSQMSVPDLWRLEAIGIQDPIEVMNQQEKEAAVLQKFEQTVQQGPDGRYIVKLPWRRDVPDLPNNRLVAEKRLLSATKKLKQKGFVEYDKVFQEWLAEGIIEEIPEDNLERCHYLPHRAVIKEESSTTKVRPVFDASCKTGRAPSLNDCLEKGPNMIDLIPDVMTRFREGKIGVISDIRKAFLMIEVAKEDRDFLRFLWWEGADCSRMKVYRHKRVVFGVNSSPFLLAAVLQHHLQKVEGSDARKEVARKLLKSMYVDNCVASVNDREELENFISVSTEIMAEAGMDLRHWQHSDRATEDMDERVVPVLGMKWDRFEDVLYCDPPALFDHDRKVTKREILSTAQKIFDPLGIISPITIQPKLLLQEAWAQKKGWDEEVDEDARERFLRWTKELPLLSQIRVPRHIFDGDDKDGWSVHCFTDASSYAYGAAIYLRCEGNPATVQLLQGKARVAPLKTSTIPRLELLGCLVGARLTTAVVGSSMKLKDVPKYYWSDSSTALSWIRRNDDWGTFVGNRVREIVTLTDAEEWSHVPGVVNPADLPSRGCLAPELLRSRWWEGPSWLKFPPTEWPTEIISLNEEEIFSERKKTVSNNVVAVAGSVQWYLRGRSGFSNMLRRACYVLRFVDKVKKIEVFNGDLSPEELRKTEKRLVKVVQQEAFPGTESFKKLGVFQDAEGLLRVKTKLLMRLDKQDFKTPMLLPTDHPFVKELVREMHIQNGHVGAQGLISMLREKYWIVHTRKAVNSVIHSCQRCKRFAAKHVEVESSALPEDRVREAAPFEIVGVDLAGPLFLRDKKKAWIVLFTCAVYRAVHLELVTSLETGHFIQALRRFISRRGRPSVVYSDNGTNFRGAANLFKSLDWDKIQKNFGACPMTWKFSPPSAPWWGGFWERMVRSVKELLVRILGKSSVLYEELVTVLCDIESVINQRPLTVMTENSDDLVALTPAMFLQGVREAGVPDLDEVDMEGMTKRFQYRQELLVALRSRFRTEYLANLLMRVQKKSNFELRVGDLVLIGDDLKKRLEWQLGKIERFIPRRGAVHGPARIAVVRTAKGILERPVRRLFPLELNPADEDEKAEVEVFTRRGRQVKKPQRFIE